MEILLTGATGFLGRNLCDALVQRDHSLSILIHKTDLGANVSKTNLVYALTQLGQGKYDAVIHCATSYGRKGEIEPVLDSNLILPLRILDAIQNTSTTFINIDSFFNKNVSQYYTLPHYSLSKKSLLIWLQYYALTRPVVNLRLEHLFGPGDGEDKFVSQAISKIGLEKTERFKLTSGLQKRDFIHVEDVCDAIGLLIENLKSYKIGFHEYEIGTGQATSIREFVEMIKEISSSTTILEFGVIETPPGEIQESFANKEFQSKFGWKPKITLEQGIRQLLDLNNQLR